MQLRTSAPGKSLDSVRIRVLLWSPKRRKYGTAQLQSAHSYVVTLADLNPKVTGTGKTSMEFSVESLNMLNLDRFRLRGVGLRGDKV